MRDPLIFSPHTVQISEANLREWEANVDVIWNKFPSNVGSKCKAAELNISAPDTNDKCKPRMLVVLGIP
jgi:hypothetical protein